MKPSWRTALALIALLSTAARAETVRHPESGDPAFTALLPDGWTHEIQSNGSLKAFSAAHTAAITLAIVHADGALDELAAKAIKSPDGMPPQAAGAAAISGYSGSAFDGTVVNSDGVKAKVHLLLVRLDDEHVAAATLLTADNLDAVQVAAAAAVLAGVMLSKIETPPEPAPAPPPATPPVPETPPATPSATPAPTTP